MGGVYPKRSPGQAAVTGVASSPPPGTRLHFLSRIGFSTPTARRFSSNVANNSRPRAFRSYFFIKEKALGDTRIYEIDHININSRHVQHLPSHRGHRRIQQVQSPASSLMGKSFRPAYSIKWLAHTFYETSGLGTANYEPMVDDWILINWGLLPLFKRIAESAWTLVVLDVDG